VNPVLDMESEWKKQFGFINSDFFKTYAATQAQFAQLGASLTKTLDFGSRPRGLRRWNRPFKG